MKKFAPFSAHFTSPSLTTLFLKTAGGVKGKGREKGRPPAGSGGGSRRRSPTLHATLSGREGNGKGKGTARARLPSLRHPSSGEGSGTGREEGFARAEPARATRPPHFPHSLPDPTHLQRVFFGTGREKGEGTALFFGTR
ncbi:MAG: hypothetical protein GH150_00250 [Hadesarchaea archaeon]|nr:hypothetical protein [Hadesarchaea archaeon]